VWRERWSFRTAKTQSGHLASKKRPIEPVIDNIAALAWPFEA
jgi:hypothetical protein